MLAGALASAISSSALAADARGGASYVVSHFEVLQGESAQVAVVTKQYALAARGEPGALAVEAYQEIARPGRFVLLEQWRDKEAADAHDKAAAAFQQGLAPLMISDFGKRVHSAFRVGPSAAQPARGAVTVLTHLDVFAPGAEQEAALVTAQAEAARKDAGNLRFDVLRWDGHPNHFTLVEVWRDPQARLAATALPHNREFRRRSTPLEGAPYDDRLYRRLE
ncbi:MAG: antibiotic biosynthesis monooxygenase [Caulobacteraceae bacterium]